MANPIVFDAREGISAEALDELRAATKVVMAMKDARTAVLGYWRQNPDEPGAADEQMGVVVTGRYGPGPVAALVEGRTQLVGRWSSRVWLLAAGGEHDEVWRRVVAMLQPGDIVLVNSTRPGWQSMPGLEIRRGAFTAYVPLREPDLAQEPRDAGAI
jgi:hypothetical protein